MHQVKSYESKHKRLKNGQNAGFYIDKARYIPQFNKDYGDDTGFTTFTIGFAIGKTRRQCNDWYNGRASRKNSISRKSTGKSGLEGLRFALDCIKGLMSNLKQEEYIIVRWGDEKRRRAYKWLTKLGFYEATHKGADVYAYHKREDIK